MYQRNCPKCNSIIKHKNKLAWSVGKKRKSFCRRCAWEIANSKVNFSTAFKGKNNPFYGQKHTDETKTKMKQRDNSYLKTIEHTAKVTPILLKYSNKKSVYSCWVKKYGKEEADRRLEKFKQKISENTKGSKNPMYGKPSPQGAGNGWSGWYNGWYFRSLRELSYVLDTIEPQNLTWKSGECKEFKIEYIDPIGQHRFYYPDFIVNNVLMVECKPIRLHNSPKVLAKMKAAKTFCEYIGFRYEIVDPVINTGLIYSLYLSGQIKFAKQYAQKFIDYMGRYLYRPIDD